MDLVKLVVEISVSNVLNAQITLPLIKIINVLVFLITISKKLIQDLFANLALKTQAKIW